MDSILIISDFPAVQYQKDSGTPAFRLIVEALAKKYTVHILAPTGGYAETSTNITYFRYYSCLSKNQILRKITALLHIRRLAKIAGMMHESEDYKLVYGAGCYSVAAAGKFGSKASIPAIGRLFGTYLYPYLWGPMLLRKYEEILAFTSPCTRLVITSDGTGGDKVADYLGIPSIKVCFWRNGVEIPPATLKCDDNVHIISMARLDKWKHVERIILAFANVAYEDPSLVLDIVGGGPEEQLLKYIARQTCPDGRVTFHGEVTRDKALELLSKSDIFMSTNDYSNISNSLMEAMAAGKPIIALDTGTTKEIVEGRGYLAQNQADLSQGIRLFTSKAERDSIGYKAKLYAQKHFQSWDSRIAREVRLCDDLIAGRLS